MKLIITLVICFTLGFTTNAIAQWVGLNSPHGYYSLGYVTAFAQKGINLYASCLTHGRVFRTTDNGDHWTLVATGLASDSVYALGSNGTDLFAGTWHGLSRLDNNDTTWTRIDHGLNIYYVRALLPNDSNVFASLVGSGIFLSTDKGTTWNARNNGLKDSDIVTCFAQSGSNLYAGSYSGVCLSTNNGTNWKNTSTGLTDTIINAIAISGKNLFAGTRTGGIFLSTDNGSHWNSANNGIIGTEIRSFAVSGTNIFAGVNQGGVFLSTNGGASWRNITDNLSDSYIMSLYVNGKYLFAGGGGVWRRPLSDLGLSEVTNSISLTNKIQITPNPTTGLISIQNVTENLTSISVMNVLGDKILEITNSHSSDLTIDLSKFVDGTYYVKFLVKGSVLVKKIVKE